MVPSEPKARLVLRDLCRHFDGRAVVDCVNLSLMPGQVTCLLGPSGCGKTTTLRMIAGIEEPDGGVIEIDGKPVCGAGPSLPPEARGIGMMFQDFALFPHLTVSQNVRFGLKSAKADKLARVTELLTRVRLLDKAEAYPHQLSGGEQQRVALARALAPRPSVMLMDEPFSGLDKRLRDGIRDETLGILRDEGTAVLLVTHEPEEAMRMADQIALMRRGKLVQTGAPYNIYNAPLDTEAAAFFSDINVIHAHVKGLQAETPFGPFLTPNLKGQVEVEIVIRPQHLKLDFDRGGKGPLPTAQDGVPGRGQVVEARFMGSESRVDLQMDDSDIVLKASTPGVFLPPKGTPLWVSLRRDRCHVFPCTRGSA
ncbi:MAG: ABC transporter ATP-binding protein [Pseudomonadota bacterium]